MTPKYYAKLLSFTLATSMILGGAALYYSQKSNYYQRYISHISERAYSEIISSLSATGSALDKMQYASDGPYLNTLAAQVWREASAAKTGLSLLPRSDIRLEQTEKFIAQAGEYAYSVLKRGRTADLADNIKSLSATSSQLTDKLWQVKERINKGELKPSVMSSDGQFPEDEMSGSFTQVEQEFPEMGTLIYDGPFSDHIEKREASLLKDTVEVKEDEALEKAKIFSGDQDLEGPTLGGDRIPIYAFKSKHGTYIEVTRWGGNVLLMTKAAEPQSRTVTPEQAIATAKQHMEAYGIPNMKESYYTIYENIMTINFAFTTGDVVVYPDLIKIGVELDGGSVVSFESRGYIMNHKSRELPPPALTIEEARGNLSTSLEVLSENRAIVPTTGANETVCYEFLCKNPDGQKVIIYINTENGLEENMLILIEDENGTLTI